MFTRCPQCARVFAVTAQQLRSAHGDVRCGNCATVFNAVESLTDEAPSPPDPPAATPTQSAAAPGADASSTVATAKPDGDDGSLEFDAPEQTWSNFFIEARPQAGDVDLDGDLETITADPDEWQAMLAEIDGPLPWQSADSDNEPGEDSAGETLPQQLAGSDDDADMASEGEATAAPEWLAETNVEPDMVFWVDEDRPGDGETRPVETAPASGAERQHSAWEPAATATDTRGEIALDDLPAAWADKPVEVRPRRRLPALLACLLLVILAAGQWLHIERDALAADPRWGKHIRSLYARLGQPLYPEWPLKAYTVRRAEAIAGSSARDALDIYAVIEISGAQAVGLPLVSITLRDQWDNPVGRGIFRPADYLAAELPPIVPPGTQIPVEISVVDPGIEARGYVVDVCLPSRRAGLRCQQGMDPFTR